MEDGRLRDTNALTLQWRSGATSVRFEVFQSGCLTTLKPRLRFDSAVWGTLDETGSGAEKQISAVHLHSVPKGTWDEIERASADDFADKRSDGHVLNGCLSDPAWGAPRHAPRRA